MSTTQKFLLKPLFNETGILPVSVTIKLQRPVNPDYIDFIVQYPGFTKLARSNKNVGSFYAYYNETSNVQYLTNPKNILYSFDTNTGIFQAISQINVNGINILALKNYKLV